ncbi:branched-chain amino acid aminotransferase [Flavobacterium agricola]|uniref:Branched-chain-amino-acid aminotransferase n=1 Tax=Flavobacterium agricola TaxID=2870839 RepID=A0ABY6M4M7_9FLAO|nr:branched-chain amino acid aminotransferase [Flavobacterium agricola]UYW02153.1 branched-chain amino acid aminotransferase [Flavobacterium agricola]
METTQISDIKIIKSPTSKIDSVDFETLTFGKQFTDHMLVCDFIDGEWHQPIIMPYAPFEMDPSSRVFHYGQAIFEGMKAYRDAQDEIWLFRPDQNYERFNKSAIRLAMPEVPEHIFMDGLKELIKIDANWIKKGNGNALYIRPFMIGTSDGVIASPSLNFKFCIILSPVKSYYSGEVKVVIADHFSRAANGGIGAAKAAGNYAAQFYPTKLANQKGFQQVIWTDDTTHTKLEESGTMNVFFRINDTLITAPVSERILDGVTRKSLLAIAERDGIKTEVRSITVNEIVDAHRNGSLKEIFGAGTAAVVSLIAGFQYKDEYFELPQVADRFATQLKEKLNAIQYNEAEDTFNWTVKL